MGNSNGSVAVRSTEQSCCDDHAGVLGKYYDDIKSCLHAAACYCVPSVKLGIQKHWWTPELDELKQKCIDATDLWNSIWRPRSGDINNNRIRCKLQYKNAITEAAANADCVLTIVYIRSYAKKDNTAFRKPGVGVFAHQNLNQPVL